MGSYPVSGSQIVGKTRKKKAREKLAEREKGREPLLSPVFSRFIFVFALSQFSRPDYLGAWNRLMGSRRLEQWIPTDMVF